MAAANETVSKETLKTITITLPATIVGKAEALAEKEGRSLSELFLAAFRAYQASAFEEWWKDLQQYAAEHNPHGYTEDEIPRLIKEVRAEMAAEEAALKDSKGLVIAVIDTNVWISALVYSKPGSIPKRVLERIVLEDTLALSREMMDEIYRILTVKQGWSRDRAALELTPF